MLTCVGCGSVLTGRRSKWCSQRCRDKARWADPQQRAIKDFYHTAWVRANPGRARHKVYTKVETSAMRHHITPERYEEMLRTQLWRCYICFDPLDLGHGTHIDHDHACCPGKSSCGQCVRHVLCDGCNNGLGRFKDDPEILARAATYVTR